MRQLATPSPLAWWARNWNWRAATSTPPARGLLMTAGAAMGIRQHDSLSLGARVAAQGPMERPAGSFSSSRR